MRRCVNFVKAVLSRAVPERSEDGSVRGTSAMGQWGYRSLDGQSISASNVSERLRSGLTLGGILGFRGREMSSNGAHRPGAKCRGVPPQLH
jgi:hypothetical protein